MRFDTVIIGGGLAGLSCGIRLQKKGLKCAIISAGQSALHFSSGSFDLLDRMPDGTPVASPAEAVAQLPDCHPYSKVGNQFGAYAAEAKKQLTDCGINVAGDADKNALRLTPMGTLRPTWLMLPDFQAFSGYECLSGKNVLIANIAGFLDFNAGFIAERLDNAGAKCKTTSIRLPQLEHLRISPTEMRSSNIARALEQESAIDSLIDSLKVKGNDADMLVVPAVFGLSDTAPLQRLQRAFGSRLIVAPTMPPSVPGIRVQQTLRHEFEKAGGVYMLGDNVVKASISNNRIETIYTVNHGNIGFVANNYVLATGSYFSNGLVAHPDGIKEPVFQADIDASDNRKDWYNEDFFSRQNYMTYGVATDNAFHVKKNGIPFENLYAIGSVLSGFNPLHEGCGGGVALITGLFVADNLTK